MQVGIRYFSQRDINPFTLSLLKEKLRKFDSGFLNTIEDPNEAYKTILQVFSNRYEISFPKIKTKVDSKTQLSPRITRNVLKFSEQKQRIYMENV